MAVFQAIQTFLAVKMDIKKITRVALAALFFISSYATAATFKVAVLDTGFCLNTPTTPALIIYPEFDASLKAGDYCRTANTKRLHGRRVVETFISALPRKNDLKIELYPIVVFDHQGYASIEAFARALEKAKEIKVDYLLLSVALPLEKNINPLPSLPTTTFVAAGRAERQITQRTILWPHHFDDPKMILVGGLNHGKKDPKALYSSMTKLFFEGSSSLANAEALAQEIAQRALP